MLLSQVKEKISEYLFSNLKIAAPEFDVIPTNKLEDGDFYTNAALKYTKQAGKPPLKLAEDLAEIFKDSKDFTVKVVKQGFLNFYLSDKYLEDNSLLFSEVRRKKVNQTSLVEYVQPNTNKPLHIGHLRNSALGVSIINLYKNAGFDVKRAVIYNNRGLHITKSMWGYLMLGSSDNAVNKDSSWINVINDWVKDSSKWDSPEKRKEKRLQKPDHFIGHYYVLANEFADKDKKVEEDWQSMLLAWEDEEDKMHTQVRKLWEFANNYFYKGYKESAVAFEFDFDEDSISYESDIYKAGKQIILDNVEKGVFNKLEDGAIEADLSKYNLPNKILVRRDGTGIYMTFDIELTRQRSKIGAKPLIWLVGSDQNLYFQQLFAVSEILGYGKLEDFLHYSYGMVRVPEGKMSSRAGTVVYADDMLVAATEEVKKVMKASKIGKPNSKEAVHAIALGALKWSMLCVEAVKDISFDLNKTVSFNGFSGPYVQYTHARCSSVLSKAEFKLDKSKEITLTEEDKNLARVLFRFPEQVGMATKDLAPHYICHYLFELCQTYNSYYGNTKIIGSRNEYSKLALTYATKKVIATGLNLLGIKAPESM